MKRFFAELARRNVARVSAAYFVLGWLVLQVVNSLVPATSLPEWSSSLLIVILLAGFPVVAISAWAFELTPDGVKRTEASGEGAASTKPLDLALLVFLGLVIAMAGFGYLRPATPPTANPEETVAPSRLAIAVLPFADMSPGGDQDWFSDGISEEIIHRLALEKQLTVAGRTSSFYFKEKNVPFEEIGRMLNVGTVLEGSVRKDGTRVRITAQLIDIESGAHRWSGTFDRELKDIFRIQEDLSVSIARELLRELGVEPTVPEADIREPSVEAFQAYLRGRKANEGYTPRAFIETAQWMEEAMELDENYAAPAVYLVGLISRTQGPGGLIPDGFRNIDKLLDEALRRKPSTIDVQLIRGYVAASKWQFHEADREFRKVQTHDSVDAGELESVANFLLLTGRSEEALPLYRDVVKKSPFYVDARFWLVVTLNSMGRYDEAIEAAREAIDLGMNSPTLSSMIAYAQGVTGDIPALEQAIAENRGLVSEIETDLETALVFYLKNDRNGLHELERKFLNAAEQMAPTFDPMMLAYIYTFLGDIERAVPQIRRAIKIKSFLFRASIGGPRDWPITAFLTRDPRGRALLEEAGYDLAWFDKPEGGK